MRALWHLRLQAAQDDECPSQLKKPLYSEAVSKPAQLSPPKERIFSWAANQSAFFPGRRLPRTYRMISYINIFEKIVWNKRCQSLCSQRDYSPHTTTPARCHPVSLNAPHTLVWFGSSVAWSGMPSSSLVCKLAGMLLVLLIPLSFKNQLLRRAWQQHHHPQNAGILLHLCVPRASVQYHRT